MIQTTVDTLKTLCDEIHTQFNVSKDSSQHVRSYYFSRQFTATMTQIKTTMSQVQDFNSQWFFKSDRSKRAPFNIVGSLLRSFFGTLAQEDAEDYLQQFNHMKTQLMDRQVILNEHTTLLQSTTDILKSINDENIAIHTKTEQQFSELRTTMGELVNDFDNFWMNMELKSQIDDLMTFISLSLELYHTKQKQFLEAITFGSSIVAATPIILPPSSFLDELTFIQHQISGNDLALPLPVSKENIATYYQIAYTRSRFINDQLLVAMSIPLLDLKEYQLNIFYSEVYQQLVPTAVYNTDIILSKSQFSLIKKVDNPHVISFGEYDKLKKFSTNIKDLQDQLTARNKDPYHTEDTSTPFSLSLGTWIIIVSILILTGSIAFATLHFEHRQIYYPHAQEVASTYAQASPVDLV
ncbi:hypothetical protein HA402_008466 [Bradysia odoriphaga]|nr:hypothetical protein HA402_008466 [Bradysia odoriphaga]